MLSHVLEVTRVSVQQLQCDTCICAAAAARDTCICAGDTCGAAAVRGPQHGHPRLLHRLQLPPLGLPEVPIIISTVDTYVPAQDEPDGGVRPPHGGAPYPELPVPPPRPLLRGHPVADGPRRTLPVRPQQLAHEDCRR